MKGDCMSAPWNRWFHCIGGTYGSWLPGGPRGFRTRHHREHVEGDYHNPPPAGIYESRHHCAEDSLRFDPVTLRPDDRAVVCRTMAAAPLAYGVELIDMSVGGQHFHALCRFPLWAKRAKFEPIRNRQHQLNVVGYIRDHACEGAVIWSQIRDQS